MKTKRGDTMAFVQLDDRSGRLEVSLFADIYNEYREKLVKDALLVISGQVSFDDYSGGLKMRGESVKSLADARQDSVRALQVVLDAEVLPAAAVTARQMAAILEPYRQGACPVHIQYRRADVDALVRLGPEWKINPQDELLLELRNTFGKGAVQLLYA
jgi:DNA polymerase-3 subunit alpha